MKKTYLLLIAMLMLVPPLSIADPIDQVAVLIRQGNIQELSKLFADNVEVSILGEENVYSKLQTEQILDKFFSQNKPKTVKVLHKVNSNAKYGFGVLIINTSNGVYRIAFTLKENGGNPTMIAFRIETDKVK